MGSSLLSSCLVLLRHQVVSKYHAADRMVNPPKGREPMTILEVEDFIDTADKIRKIKIDDCDASVTLMNSKYPKAPSCSGWGSYYRGLLIR